MQTPEQLPSERSLVLTAPLETTSSWQKCPLASSRLSSSGWKASLQRRLLAHPHLCPQQDHPAKITHYNWELLPRHPLPFAFVPFRETDARRERQGEGERRDLILYKLGRAASRQDAPPGLLHLWDWCGRGHSGCLECGGEDRVSKKVLACLRGGLCRCRGQRRHTGREAGFLLSPAVVPLFFVVVHDSAMC